MHEHTQGGAEGGERESQVDSGAWSATWGSISQSQDHDLSKNHELNTKQTEPPRHPIVTHF